MPEIKFKLKDPKYCNGCFNIRYSCLFNCYMCVRFVKKIKLNLFYRIMLYFYGIFNHKIKRPAACIEKYGE